MEANAARPCRCYVQHEKGGTKLLVWARSFSHAARISEPWGTYWWGLVNCGTDANVMDQPYLDDARGTKSEPQIWRERRSGKLERLSPEGHFASELS
jgi:hypothetical protein